MAPHPGDPLAIANYNQRLTTALRLLRRRVKHVADALEQAADELASDDPGRRGLSDHLRACAQELHRAEADARAVRRAAAADSNAGGEGADASSKRDAPGPQLGDVIDELRRRP